MRPRLTTGLPFSPWLWLGFDRPVCGIPLAVSHQFGSLGCAHGEAKTATGGPEARPFTRASSPAAAYQLPLDGQPAFAAVVHVRVATPLTSVMMNVLPVFESTSIV